MRLRDRNYLIAKMAERHFSLANVAALANCSKSTVGHLVSGERSTCSPRMAVAIERALGCSPGEMFEARALKRTA